MTEGYQAPKGADTMVRSDSSAEMDMGSGNKQTQRDDSIWEVKGAPKGNGRGRSKMKGNVVHCSVKGRKCNERTTKKALTIIALAVSPLLRAPPSSSRAPRPRILARTRQTSVLRIPPVSCAITPSTSPPSALPSPTHADNPWACNALRSSFTTHENQAEQSTPPACDPAVRDLACEGVDVTSVGIVVGCEVGMRRAKGGVKMRDQSSEHYEGRMILPARTLVLRKDRGQRHSKLRNLGRASLRAVAAGVHKGAESRAARKSGASCGAGASRYGEGPREKNQCTTAVDRVRELLRSTVQRGIRSDSPRFSHLHSRSPVPCPVANPAHAANPLRSQSAGAPPTRDLPGGRRLHIRSQAAPEVPESRAPKPLAARPSALACAGRVHARPDSAMQTRRYGAMFMPRGRGEGYVAGFGDEKAIGGRAGFARGYTRMLSTHTAWCQSPR
ncbi:hypothetical protein DFH08DRAFT_807224 [Mycena albidolilacea]|uniref:Uncharacterized protein n=1 Tax=Mycena albidolilacea TaxID=1033008 RepID=A0AAD7ET11_9AGAR|nr:hypothetical protein DFH08DRAFT_807224 [Mycena albidolilacea]